MHKQYLIFNLCFTLGLIIFQCITFLMCEYVICFLKLTFSQKSLYRFCMFEDIGALLLNANLTGTVFLCSLSNLIYVYAVSPYECLKGHMCTTTDLSVKAKLFSESSLAIASQVYLFKMKQLKMTMFTQIIPISCIIDYFSLGEKIIKLKTTEMFWCCLPIVLDQHYFESIVHMHCIVKVIWNVCNRRLLFG